MQVKNPNVPNSEQPQTGENEAVESRNARPATDDSVVEAIDEANPGVDDSPQSDAVPPTKTPEKAA